MHSLLHLLDRLIMGFEQFKRLNGFLFWEDDQDLDMFGVVKLNYYFNSIILLLLLFI